MSAIVPSQIFLTKGKGQHKEKLASFEMALRDAGIAPFNLVKISSIFPPQCELISREEGLKLLKPGQILFLVLSENASNEAYRMVSASIGLALPNNPSHYGYLAEHHGFGQTEADVGQYAEDLAAFMLATTLGKDFDLNQIWGEEKSIYQVSENITVKTRHITQTATGKKGLWSTVIAAAVCIT